MTGNPYLLEGAVRISGASFVLTAPDLRCFLIAISLSWYYPLVIMLVARGL